MNNLEENKEKISEIILKFCEKNENLKAQMEKEVEKQGKLELYYLISGYGSDFKVKYDIETEKVELFFDNQLKESYILKIEELTSMDKEQFYEKYISKSYIELSDKEHRWNTENEKKYFVKDNAEAKKFYENQEKRENNPLESKEEKIFKIISKNYELLKPENFHMDSFSYKNLNDLEKEFKNEAKESLRTGKIKLFSSKTEEGYLFETKYDLKKEELEVFVNGKLKESTKVKFNDLVKNSNLEKWEFHEKYRNPINKFVEKVNKYIFNVKNEQDIKVDPWSKKIEEFKSKDKGLER